MPRKPTALDKALSKPASLLPKETKDSTPKTRGVPKGYVQAKTIQKEEAKAIVRQMVIDSLAPLVRAQMDVAKGISHFMLRDPESGEFRRLTDPEEIEKALNAPGASEGSTYWIYTKDPQTPAFTALMDRAIGKPIEEIQADVTVTNKLDSLIRGRFERAGS